MRRVLLTAAIAIIATPAWPQDGVPLGGEFRINTYTTSVTGVSCP
jgi:hypothetical protein